MELGLSVASQIPGLDGSALIAAIEERADAAFQAGLTSLHLGDKHAVGEPYAANFALAGRLSAIWPGRFGVLVISPFWNPVLLGEQIATLAASVQDLTVVVALGDGTAHFESVGIPIEDRLSLFTEGLAVTHALLGGETVTAQVGPYAIREASIALSSGQPIRWLIAASAPAAVKRAARIGDGWLASAKLTPSEARAALGVYRDAGGSGAAVIRRDLYIGSSSEDVARHAEAAIGAGHRGYPDEAIMRGTLDGVAAAIGEFSRAGFDELLARSLVPDQELAVNSIRRLGELVTRSTKSN